jgi:hypothetical protein
MEHPIPCCGRILLITGLTLLLQLFSVASYGQTPVDSSLKISLSHITKDAVKRQIPKSDSLKIDIKNPFKNLLITRPAIRINGGMISYNFNYRSFLDRPYAEKDLMQHNVMGKFNVTVAGNFPLQVNYWIRQTNSPFFKNIYDVQVSFNGNDFHNNLQSKMRERLLALAPGVKDSLLEKLYNVKLSELTGLGRDLNSLFYPQKLIEANEILKVPKLTWNAGLPDSINLKREDSIKQTAALYLHKYEETKKRYDALTGQVDSLKKAYHENLEKVNQFKQMIGGNWNDLQSVRDWKNRLHEYGMDNVPIPAKYRWLLGVRNFSVGRSPVNYSELTAKNISVNGINLEYNSWYYFAATAGTVNYRFRDFVVNGLSKKPQFLYMVRAGIGRPEKNYFILSGFSGQKQISTNTIHISGISAESRWALNRTSYLTAEVAKSIAPDYRNNPPEAASKLDLTDKNNQAIALHLVSNIPETGSRLEAAWKKTGANYQSFSSYTSNAAMESWMVKGDQNFFKRRLRISASLRKNEFTNPFVIQNYSSNTIFKSLTASLRMRKWPVITIGYQPFSQLTKVGNDVLENRFQTFTGTLFHSYQIKQLRLATTVMVNKFYNNSSDTGFIYYNATNSYFSQSFFFPSFSANVGASFTKNSNYTLQILDGGVQPYLSKLGTIGIGIKINNLNNSVIKAGGYVTANIRVHKQDMLLVSYEHGYLPGAHSLVRNEMGTVQFIKAFNF